MPLDVMIKVPEELIAQMVSLNALDKDNPRSFEERLLEFAWEGLSARQVIDLDNEDLDALVNDMFEYALQHEKTLTGKPFRIIELYAHLDTKKERPWNKLSASARKAIGKRFGALIKQHPNVDGLRVALHDKTVSNAAIYKVVKA